MSLSSMDDSNNNNNNMINNGKMQQMYSSSMTKKLEASDEPTTTTTTTTTPAAAAAVASESYGNGSANGGDGSLLRAVRRHAAFPALQLLLEKCMMAMHFNPSADEDTEEARRRSHHLSEDSGLVADATAAAVPASSIAAEIRREIFEIDDVLEMLQAASATRPMEGEQPVADEDCRPSEVDQLVRHAILHLRVQLLELEKVWQLCEVFARKYADFLHRRQVLSSSFHCTTGTHWRGTAACGPNASGGGEAQSYNNNNNNNNEEDVGGRPADEDDDVFGRCGRGDAVSVRSLPTSSSAFYNAKTVKTVPFRKRGRASGDEMEETEKGGRSSTLCVHGRYSARSGGCAEYPQKRCRRDANACSRPNAAMDETASTTPLPPATDGRAVNTLTAADDGSAGEERIPTLPATDSASSTAKLNHFPAFAPLQHQQHLIAVMVARQQQAASMLGVASSSSSSSSSSTSLPALHYNNGKPSPVDQQQLFFSQLFLLRQHLHGGCPPTAALPFTGSTNFNLTYATERPSPTPPEAST